jgi:integrase
VRLRGEGGVIMGIRKRGKSWEVTVWQQGRDPSTGRRRRRCLTVHGSRRDAARKLAEALQQRDTGTDLSPGRLTVGDYLRRWLRDYAAHNVAPSTLTRYRGIIENHLIPALGSLRLRDLRPGHIQDAYARFLGPEGRASKHKHGPLSARTVLHHHRLIKEALAQAVRWQDVSHNAADGVSAPRPARPEMRVLGAEEVSWLLEAAAETPLYALVYLALHTGLRQGELLGLRWQDIDLDRGTLHVQRTAQRLKGQGVIYRPPKSHRSSRPVSLSPEVVALLREHRRLQVEHKLRVGPAYRGLGLVFASPLGGPMDAGNLRRAFARLLDRAALPRIRFHDLRHTAATLMLTAGVHPKVVSERLGHATVALTLDTYSHVLPDLQRDAAEALDRVLGPALRQPRAMS